MLNVTLRMATEQDSEFVFLVKKASLGEYIEQTWGWDEGFQRQFHENDYEPSQTQIIVASGHDVGWLVVAETDTEFQLQEIYLKPDHQRRGIGTHLIRLLLEKADRQVKPVKLQVLKVNVRARQLYERLRFETVGETDTHYVMSRGGPTSR
jgi:ribosomal protein S18 acetylase RimI-like enzyme